MFTIKLTNNEEEIIEELTDLFWDTITERNLDKYKNNRERLFKLGLLNEGNNQLTVIELYAILNYLIWATRELHVFNIGKVELTSENLQIIKKLQAKIHYILNKKLNSEFIYFDYDDSVAEIAKNENKVILEKLGEKYEEITLYPPIYKKFKEDNCNIKRVLCNDNKAILIPEHKTYFIYQKKI